MFADDAGSVDDLADSFAKALWTARELATHQAVELGAEFLNLGTSRDDLAEGQERFRGGRRAEWRLR